MPFKSFKQQRYLFAREPAIAKRWAHKYGTIKKKKKKRTRRVARKMLKK